MSTPGEKGGRFHAYIRFVIAVLYFFLARVLARHAAAASASDLWQPLAEQAILAVLLLLGYAGFGLILDRQLHPIEEQGLPLRQGWTSEAGLGLAFGWAVAVACVLPLVVAGGIAIVLTPQLSSWGWLIVDMAYFACATLAEEIAFRGYGFQSFAESVGPFGAAFGFAAFYAILQSLQPGASSVSIAVSAALSLLLSAAYLRSRALWVSWSLNFGWKASRALLFGLAVNGVSSHSPVVQGDPMGPYWLTGGGFGLDGSWLALLVLLAAIPVLFKVTSDLDFRYNPPVIVSGGIPVDLDAAAQAQHEAAMGPAEPPPSRPLVQIAPVAAPQAETEQPPPDQAIQPR